MVGGMRCWGEGQGGGGMRWWGEGQGGGGDEERVRVDEVVGRGSGEAWSGVKRKGINTEWQVKRG